MKFQKLKSGDRFYTSENHLNNICYGSIVFECLQELPNLSMAETVLKTLVTGLQSKLSILYNAGIITETTLTNHEIGLVDYWQDAAQVDWKIKAWTNKKLFVIYYIKNITEVSVAFEDSVFTHPFGAPK